MTVLERWASQLDNGTSHLFSPSGEALLFQSFQNNALVSQFEIHFVDGRVPLVVEEESIILPIAWASDHEVVYKLWGKPFGKADASMLWVFCVDSGEKRPLIKSENLTSIVYSGVSGHLSVLSDQEDKPGIYDLHTDTGELEPISYFDSALKRLKVYPRFGHAFCHQRQEVVVTAETQEEYQAADKERSAQGVPYCLFLLSASEDFQEIPGTSKCHHPIWSPDGTVLSFLRSESHLKTGSTCGVCTVRRDDFQWARLGGTGPLERLVMHPSCGMLAQLEYDSLADKPNRAGWKTERWVSFRLRDGEIKPE